MNYDVNTNAILNKNGSAGKQHQHSAIFLRKRKMIMVMPLLVIPFLTMAFWALGGGKGDQSATTANTPGLNLNLPDANLEDDQLMDKLSFYEKADKDSVKKEEWMRSDPYYKGKADTAVMLNNELEQLTQNSASKYNQRLNPSPYEITGNNPEQRIMKKLTLLEKEMNNQPVLNNQAPVKGNQSNQNNEFSGEVERLENMMQVMNNQDGEDSEMRELNGTLEKILDIQHPQRVKDKLKEKSLQQKDVVFAVSKQPVYDNVSLLDSIKKKVQTGSVFHGVDNQINLFEDNNGIEAVVHANQVIVNGAVIKLRLTTAVYINGILIPKGNCIYGIASLNDERLEIEINSVRNGNSLFPVKLEVYDLDGLSGIYIPGAITRDVAKQSADNGLQLMELTSMDPSFKAQETAAGINTVKTMLSRKVKQVKVFVKAGYKVLLQDKNIQQ